MTFSSVLTYILFLIIIAITLFNLYATITAKKRKQISSQSFQVKCKEIEDELLKIQKQNKLDFSYIKRMANDQDEVIILVKDLKNKVAAIAMKDDIKTFFFSSFRGANCFYEKSNKKILSAKVEVTINDDIFTYNFGTKPFRQNGIIGKVIIETCEEFVKALNDINEP